MDSTVSRGVIARGNPGGRGESAYLKKAGMGGTSPKQEPVGTTEHSTTKVSDEDVVSKSSDRWRSR